MPRRAITVTGVVQGVGFRPFVHGLAIRHQLSGYVRNRVGTVEIEVEGRDPSLDDFFEELRTRPPVLAKIDKLSWQPRPSVGSGGFRIDKSCDSAVGDIYLSPDIATCPDCLKELFDPHDRRYRYPFINCTNCGPRLTIVRAAPYDRCQTTMAGFPMCDACRAEYENPVDRRFHAEPIACPVCGPQLQLHDSAGKALESGDPIARVVEVVRAGGIGAVKSLGGFHLVCDACNDQAVSELRRRKHRDEKPFAIMIEGAAAASRLCEVKQAERLLLEQSAGQIVLLRKKTETLTAGSSICEAVAPQNPCLGVMLPYTPLHHLLMAALDGAPLVMTSGNRSDEPIAYRGDDVFSQLSNIADVFLGNNRPIHVRCDDSVVKQVGPGKLLLRRSRGYAPLPIKLPSTCDMALLAVGGQFKNVFALSQRNQVILSQHMGDLDHFESYRQFEHDIRHFERLFRISPQAIAHDLHPDYASTQYAVRRADELGVPLVAVQHHHAHMASCMADNGLNEPTIGVTFDGTGYGLDEKTSKPTIWGGEFLVGDYHEYRRAAHLRNVRMPGGDQAVHEPWRMAAAYLQDAGCNVASLESRVSKTKFQTVQSMLEKNVNCPMTSSVGRLFDAVAALLGFRDSTSYEGQAAVELEWLADRTIVDGTYPYDIGGLQPSVIDTRPLLQAIAKDIEAGTDPARVARRFHSTVVAFSAEMCDRIHQKTGLDVVALSGGVFMNSLLAAELAERLKQRGFRVYLHREVPPNDGGLSLGQVAVAAAKLTLPRDSRSTFTTALEIEGNMVAHAIHSGN